MQFIVKKRAWLVSKSLVDYFANISAKTRKKSKLYFWSYLRSNGVSDYEKNQRSKISCYYPFKDKKECWVTSLIISFDRKYMISFPTQLSDPALFFRWYVPALLSEPGIIFRCYILDTVVARTQNYLSAVT